MGAGPRLFPGLQKFHHVGLDARGSQRARHGNPVVAVAHVVLAARAVDRYRGKGRTALGRVTHLRPAAAAPRGRPEGAVERDGLVADPATTPNPENTEWLTNRPR